MALLTCLLFVLALRWHAVWTIGFYQDDAVSSSWLYEARITNRSTLAYCRDAFWSMVTDQGRITPIYNFAIQPVIMLVEERLWLYRLVQAAFHLAALLAFGAWLRRAGAGVPFLSLCVAILASIYEIRDYHDPSFSQAMTVSVTALFGFLALERATAMRCADSSGWSRQAACSGLILAALLTHEFGAGFIVAAASTAFLASSTYTRKFANAAAVSLPSLILLGIGLRLKVHSTYSGTSFGSSSLEIVGITFLKQAMASLPLNYSAAHPAPLRMPAATLYLPNAILATLGALLVAAVCWYCTRSTVAPARGVAQVAAAILLLTSATLTSVSAKYQQELRWGTGYAQIYLQYFALSVMLAGALWGLVRLAGGAPISALPRACRLVAAGGLACAFFVSFTHSIAVADHINRRWRYPREVLAIALADQAHSRRAQRVEMRVERDGLERWENHYFLFQHTGWRGRFLPATATDADPDPALQRFAIAYPHSMIDKFDLVLFEFYELVPLGGRAVRGEGALYVLGTSREKLEAAFLVGGVPSRRIALRDLRTHFSSGWWYKRVDLVPGGAPGNYGITLS